MVSLLQSGGATGLDLQQIRARKNSNKYIRDEICQIYNYWLAGAQWNFVKIVQVVALSHVMMGSKSFFA
jgi:hypothetical protein